MSSGSSLTVHVIVFTVSLHWFSLVDQLVSKRTLKHAETERV